MDKTFSNELLYPELSYQINGILFSVHNRLLEEGYREKHVQLAVAVTLKENNIKFSEQILVPLLFEGKRVGSYFIDFAIEDKIVLELKVADKVYKKDFDQVKKYLIQSGLKLGLLARFGKNGVKIYRVLRPA